MKYSLNSLVIIEERSRLPENSTAPHSTERSVMPASNKTAPPLWIDCIVCANKMELISVEPDKNRTVYTYRCLNEHLQQLTIAKH